MGDRVLLLAVLAVLPFLLNYDAAADGLGRVTERAPFDRWARDHGALYGLFAFLVATAYGIRLASSRHPWRTAAWAAAAAVFLGSLLAADNLTAVAGLVALCWVAAHAAFVRPAPGVERFVWVLIGGGLLCLLIPEVVYVKDSFDGSDLYRMNTVFKLGYQAWLLLAIAGSASVIWSWGWLGRRARWVPFAWACRCSPASRSSPSIRSRAPTPARTASRSRRTSAGWRWLEPAAPGDPPAIDVAARPRAARLRRARVRRRRLLRLRPRPHLDLHGPADGDGLDRPRAAVGARPRQPPRRRRPRSTRRTDAAVARPLLDKYGVRYVVVGPIERADHGDAGLAKWDQLGRRVFDRDGTTVWGLR